MIPRLRDLQSIDPEAAFRRTNRGSKARRCQRRPRDRPTAAGSLPPSRWLASRPKHAKWFAFPAKPEGPENEAGQAR